MNGRGSESEDVHFNKQLDLRVDKQNRTVTFRGVPLRFPRRTIGFSLLWRLAGSRNGISAEALSDEFRDRPDAADAWARGIDEVGPGGAHGPREWAAYHMKLLKRHLRAASINNAIWNELAGRISSCRGLWELDSFQGDDSGELT
jgi:hypothetical protein